MKKKETLRRNSQNEGYLYSDYSRQRFFVSTSRGFEDILKEELEEICTEFQINSSIWKGSAGCYLESSWSGCIATNLASMCASRVLLVLAENEVRNEKEIYELSRQIDWTVIFNKNLTFSVNASINDTFIRNSMFVGLKVKDAICDSFHDKYGERPNVSTDNPDVKIFVRLFREKLSISVDTTGDPLSRRGYRVETVEAPLRESLAASLLRISGWNHLAKSIWNSSEAVYFEDKDTKLLKDQPNANKNSQILMSPYLLDPMCGSGTFVIEAALCLLHWKPNVHRKDFVFMDLCTHKAQEIKTAFRELKIKILANEKPLSDLPMRIKLYAEKNNIKPSHDFSTPFLGSDYLEHNIETARKCAKEAGISKLVTFSKKDAFFSKPHASQGLLLVNPPYGERLDQGEDLRLLYRSLGDLWKQEFPHWTAWLLTGSEEGLKKVGLRPTRKVSVYNGSIQCKFLQYVMYPRNPKVPN
jgi:23S rRNA G2445 N2-methylase RlmL